MSTLKQQGTAGELDISFGINGKVILDYPGSTISRSAGIALQADSKLLIAGTANRRFTIARLNTDGSPDKSFGNDGFIESTFKDGFEASGTGLRSLKNGKILLLGKHIVNSNESHTAVARFDAQGRLDTSFGTNGVFIFKAPLKEGSTVQQPQADKTVGHSDIDSIEELPDGRIYILSQHSGYPSYGLIARLNENGSLDESFRQGYIIVLYPNYPTSIYSMLITSEGGIIAAGTVTAPNKPSSGVLFRFLSDGQPDLSFGDKGIKLLKKPREVSDAYQIKSITHYDKDHILCIGSSLPPPDNKNFSAGILLGRKPEGQKDENFNGGQIVKTHIREMTLLWEFGQSSRSQDKVVVVGLLKNNTLEKSAIIIGRYHLTNADTDHPAGALDEGFANGKGWTSTPLESATNPTGMALQTDGNIIVCGFTLMDNQLKVFVMRYLG